MNAQKIGERKSQDSLDSDKGGKIRTNRLSETGSEAGSDASFDGFSLSDTDTQSAIKHLLEMFPYACTLEVSHCLQFMAGDVERAAELIMNRYETGQSLKPKDKKVIKYIFY